MAPETAAQNLADALATMAYQIVRRKDQGAVVISAVMIVSFLSAHSIANFSGLIIPAQSLRFIVVATALLLLVFSVYPRWQIAVAASIHLAIVAVGFAADFGVLFEGRRPMQFIAWSFPDVSAGLQHAALLVLALGTHKREDVAMGLHPRPGGRRGAYGLATVAVREGESKAP